MLHIAQLQSSCQAVGRTERLACSLFSTYIRRETAPFSEMLLFLRFNVYRTKSWCQNTRCVQAVRLEYWLEMRILIGAIQSTHVSSILLEVYTLIQKVDRENEMYSLGPKLWWNLNRNWTFS